MLLQALHSTLVEADSLVAEHIPVAVDSLVVVDNLVEEDSLVVEEDNLVEEGILEVAHTLVMEGILEVAFATQPCRIVAAHVDQDLSHALLMVVVQEMAYLQVGVLVLVLLLVVQLVVPGCSYVTTPLLTLVNYPRESCARQEFPINLSFHLVILGLHLVILSVAKDLSC